MGHNAFENRSLDAATRYSRRRPTIRVDDLDALRPIGEQSRYSTIEYLDLSILSDDAVPFGIVHLNLVDHHVFRLENVDTRLPAFECQATHRDVVGVDNRDGRLPGGANDDRSRFSNDREWFVDDDRSLMAAGGNVQRGAGLSPCNRIRQAALYGRSRAAGTQLKTERDHASEDQCRSTRLRSCGSGRDRQQ